jgi:hypothetical protein
MLMEDPQRALLWRLPPPIAPLTHEQLAARREVKRTLRRASQTAVVLVKRAWNESANQLARTALDEATPTMRRRTRLT